MEHQDHQDIVRDVCKHCGFCRADHGDQNCFGEQTAPAPGYEFVLEHCPGFVAVSERSRMAACQASEFMRAVTALPPQFIL